MGYYARSVAILEDSERFRLDRWIPPDNLRKLTLNLQQLTLSGWSPDNKAKLYIAVNGLTDLPDVVIEHMQNYTERYHEMKIAIGIIKLLLSEASA